MPSGDSLDISILIFSRWIYYIWIKYYCFLMHPSGLSFHFQMCIQSGNLCFRQSIILKTDNDQ